MKQKRFANSRLRDCETRHIMTFLDRKTRWGTCTLVSKSWNSLVRDVRDNERLELTELTREFPISNMDYVSAFCDTIRNLTTYDESNTFNESEQESLFPMFKKITQLEAARSDQHNYADDFKPVQPLSSAAMDALLDNNKKSLKKIILGDRYEHVFDGVEYFDFFHFLKNKTFPNVIELEIIVY